MNKPIDEEKTRQVSEKLNAYVNELIAEYGFGEVLHSFLPGAIAMAAQYMGCSREEGAERLTRIVAILNERPTNQKGAPSDN